MGAGRRLGRAGGGWAQTEGSRAPGPPPRPGSGGLWAASAARSRRQLAAGWGGGERGLRGRGWAALEARRRQARQSWALAGPQPRCASSPPPRTGAGQGWATVTSPPPHPIPPPLLLRCQFLDASLAFGVQKGGRLDEGGSLTPSTLGPSVASPSFFSPTLPLLGLGAPSIAGKVGRRFSQKWLGKESGRKSSG